MHSNYKEKYYSPYNLRQCSLPFLRGFQGY